MDRRNLPAQLLMLLVLMWMTMPEHQRREFLMRMIARGLKLTDRAASALGRSGMRQELVGVEEPPAYDAAYRLMSGPRQRLVRLYNGLRGATL